MRQYPHFTPELTSTQKLTQLVELELRFKLESVGCKAYTQIAGCHKNGADARHSASHFPTSSS